MTKEENNDLRKQAENIVNSRSNDKNSKQEEYEYIHELRVHQIELEIQNEELKYSQIKLEEARRKYFELYNFAPVGYVTLNENGLILDINLRGAELLGIERLDLLNRALIQYIKVEDRNKFHKYLLKVVNTVLKQSLELELINKDGSSFHALLETVKIEYESGILKGYNITFTDITNLKNKEKMLKQQAALLDLSNEAIFSWDYEDGAITSWNHGAEKLYGYTLNEAKDQDSNKLLKTEFPQSWENFKQKISAEKIWVGELKHRTKAGHTIIVESHQQLITDNANKQFVIEANREITKRKKMEKLMEEHTIKLENINKILNVEIGDYEKAEIKLEKIIEKYKISNKELEQFAYISSHDLKEPLRMITSFLQLLQKRYGADLDDDANDFIDFAVEGAKRLDMMINDLLEYSRVGNEQENFEYLNSEEILETVLNNLNSLIKDNNAKITHDILPVIYANRNMMIQLFQNIIGNAIKYHGTEEPKVHISSEESEEYFIFSIKDNGIGIEKKHIDKIFTIFQRLNTREEYEGTGIGLAISKKIIKKHYGSIWAESEPGIGTTFYFTIPLKKLNYSYKLFLNCINFYTKFS